MLELAATLFPPPFSVSSGVTSFCHTMPA